MDKDDYTGLIIILVIIAIVAFSGNKKMNGGRGLFYVPPPIEQPKTNEQKKAEVQAKIEDLKKQIQAKEDEKYQSKYKGLVSIQYVNRSTDPASEYIVLRVKDDATTTIPVTGWRIQSKASGSGVDLPKGTQLFLAGMVNTEDAIILSPGDTVYITTGLSPNGSSFRLNKCSGYLSQFQTFTPYISTNCPAPRDEDSSSIPKRVENDSCFDYIDSFPTCRIQTENLPPKFSYECSKFIYDKINYPSCVYNHKRDSDFYLKEWRVYLKRSETIWKNRREEIVLYDSDKKIVDTLKY